MKSDSKNELCNNTLSNLNKRVQVPDYDRSQIEIGIVHLGPGAFHRAHQAVYTDDLLRLNYKNWGICAVSLNSARFRDSVKKQDNLYTLAIRDIDPKLRIVGSIIEILFAPDSHDAVIARLSERNVKVVTLTITEKGYCLLPNNRLDFGDSDIKFDLEHPDTPKTAIGYLSAGLHKRYQQNLDPFVLVSCDNLMDNGVVLKQAVVDFSYKIDQDLANWISNNVFSPRTMVDSITPTTNQALIKSVEDDLGFLDEWPVQRENFSQWIFEDVPGMVLPPWDSVGAVFGADIKKYESCKLKILNGLHSSIAFVGLITGFETVAEALDDKSIRDYVQKLLDSEIIPSLSAPEGLDIETYASAVLKRFKNTQIHHFLSQIAWDSSKKIPVRILDTLQDNYRLGNPCGGLCLAISSWMLLIETMVSRDIPIVDPIVNELKGIIRRTPQNGERVDAFLALDQVFPKDLVDNSSFRRAVVEYFLELKEDPMATLKKYSFT
mgnify:FL=1